MNFIVTKSKHSMKMTLNLKSGMINFYTKNNLKQLLNEVDKKHSLWKSSERTQNSYTSAP